MPNCTPIVKIIDIKTKEKEKRKRKLEMICNKSSVNWGECGGYYITPVVINQNKVLSETSKKVLSYLISLWLCCDKVYPSIERIMEVTSSPRRNVYRAKSQLLDLGLISITHQGTGRGDSNIYQVNEEAINNFLGVELFTITKQSSGDNRTSGRKKLN